jgi:hypothetical protein
MVARTAASVQRTARRYDGVPPGQDDSVAPRLSASRRGSFGGDETVRRLPGAGTISPTADASAAVFTFPAEGGPDRSAGALMYSIRSPPVTRTSMERRLDHHQFSAGGHGRTARGRKTAPRRSAAATTAGTRQRAPTNSALAYPNVHKAAVRRYDAGVLTSE